MFKVNQVARKRKTLPQAFESIQSECVDAIQKEDHDRLKQLFKTVETKNVHGIPTFFDDVRCFLIVVARIME